MTDDHLPTVSEPVSIFLADQTRFERHALSLIAHPDVREVVAQQARRWQEGSPGLLSETYAQIDASIREVALLVALQVINGDPLRPGVVEISAGPHHWGGLMVPGGRWGINNPDTLYFAVPIDSGSRYILHGHRRGIGPIDVNFSVQVRDVWATVDNLGRRDLVIDDQGRYRILIDGQAAGGRINHLQSKPDAGVLIVRQTLSDWNASHPDVLRIERIDAQPPTKPRSETELVTEFIHRLGDVITHSLNALQPSILAQPPNHIPSPGPAGDKAGYLVTQRNTLGHFLLEDDEALVAELTPGGAGYCAFTLTNAWGITPDSSRHQHSLNLHQAEIGPDGRITLVVAQRDPGIANWIDTAGLRQGFIMLRWQLLDEHPSPNGGPDIRVRKVSFGSLASELPAQVRRINVHERQRLSTARKHAYLRRFIGR